MRLITRLKLLDISQLFVPDIKDLPLRRHDLDWLRIIVFALLILFHCGMYYVENWGWHAKSHYQSQLLENIMLFIEPWRMPVLWLIAGISIRFIMAKVSVWRFISMRSLRLLLPLLFGVLVVVPPQLYVEMSYKGELNMSYWQFMIEFFSSKSQIFDNYQSGIWPHMDVNHLWFIRALWQYSLALLCLIPLLNSKVISNTINNLFKRNGVLAIIIATLPLFIIQISWEMSAARYPLGFTLMVYGYLIGWNPRFWQRMSHGLKPLLISFFACYILFIIFYNIVWLDIIHGAQDKPQSIILTGMFTYSLLRVLGVLTVFAFAHQFLNKQSKKLNYFNDAVYPSYILHQTFILVIGYNLSSLNLGPYIESLLLITLTVISCFIGYELIRRTVILRPFFGLKIAKNFPLKVQQLGYIAALMLMVPIGLEILL